MTGGLLGQLTGTPTELVDILAPAYAVARPASETIGLMDYWDAQLTFFVASPPPGYFQERSRFFRGPLSGDAIATAFHWARQWPGTSEDGHMSLFQTGGAVNAVSAEATAFVHR